MNGPARNGSQDPGGQLGLVKRMIDGDEAAFREFSDRYSPRLMGFCTSQGLSARDAQSVMVTTISKAAMKITTFSSENLWAWLTGIARRELIEHWRQHARFEFVEEETLDLLAATDSATDDTESNAGEVTPTPPGVAAVGEAMAKLPPADRQVISLRFGPPELTSDEVGRLLGLQAGTVRQRLKRALERLKAILTKDDRVQGRLVRRSKVSIQP